MGKDFCTKSTLLPLGLGQLLSILLAFTGFTASQLAKKGIDVPLSLCFLSYVLLTLFYGGIMLYRREPLKGNWLYYILLAYVDVVVKFLVIEAYQYTSITSIMLLDSWTIPFVMLLTWLYFDTKYGFQELVGVAICVVCLVTVVFFDTHFAEMSSGNNHLKGDLAIIIAGLLYGVMDVCKAILVKKADRVELMAFLGFFGAIISASLIPKSEINEYKSILSSPETLFLFIGFSLAIFLFSLGVPLLLKISGPVMLNLSLLTSNIMAVLIRIFAYHEKVNWIYFVAFAAVTLGLIIYSRVDDMDSNIGLQAPSIDEEVGLGYFLIMPEYQTIMTDRGFHLKWPRN